MTIYVDAEGPYQRADGTYILRVIEHDDDGRQTRYSVEGSTPEACREQVALLRMDRRQGVMMWTK